MQVEQFNHKFEKNEMPQIREQAEQEGWKEGLERAINSKLVQLEERMDTDHPPLEMRYSELKQFVVSNEENTGTTEPRVSPENFVASQKEKLTQSFRQELAGGDDFDITDPKDWKGSVALVAFDWLQESKKTSTNPDAKWADKGMAIFKSIFGGILMKSFAGDSYEKFEASLANLNSGILPESKSENTDLENIDENSSETLKYKGTIEVLKFLSKKPNQENQEFSSIMNEKSIKDLSLNDFHGISQGIEQSDIYKDLKEKGYEELHIENALSQIGNGKIYDILNNIMIHSEHKDEFSNYPLSKIISIAGKDLFMLKKIGSGEFQINDISFENDSQKNGEKQKKVEIASLFITDVELKGESSDIVDKITGGHEENEEKKPEILRIVEFGLELQQNFISDERYHLANDLDMGDILGDQPLTAVDAAKLYFITKGNPNIDEWNTIQKAVVYFNMPDILDDREKNGENGAYTVALIENVLGEMGEDSTTQLGRIPDDVRLLLQEQFTNALGIAVDGMADLGETLIGAFKQNKAVGGTLLAAALILPILSKRTSLLGSLFGK